MPVHSGWEGRQQNSVLSKGIFCPAEFFFISRNAEGGS